MQSKMTTVRDYLAEMPPDRREAIQAVREVILKNLDKDYEEGMQYGMIGYYVPHRVYPPGYHCDPKIALPFGGLASQKNHMSVYFMSLYGDSEDENWFRKAWEKTGRKLDMGKCCIRFKKVEDLALDLIGEAVRRMPAARYVEYYESMRENNWNRSSAKKASPRKKSVGGKAKASKSPLKKAAAKTSATTRSRSTKSPKKKTGRSAR